MKSRYGHEEVSKTVNKLQWETEGAAASDRYQRLLFQARVHEFYLVRDGLTKAQRLHCANALDDIRRQLRRMAN